MRRCLAGQKGFTIAELLIATAVFGMVLLIITTSILQLSHVYQKGVNETKVQTTTRTIVDNIAQSIQFNGGPVTTTNPAPVPGNSYGFCVGNKQYSYTTGYQLADAPTSAQTYHALVVYDLASCTPGSFQDMRADADVDGRELLSPKMRLAKMQVEHVGGTTYKISVRVVYGDDDLIFDPTDPSDADGYRNSNAACKVKQKGSQFCAASEITTTVTKRVE